MLPLKEFYPRHYGLGAENGKEFYLYIPKCASTSIKKTFLHTEANIKDYQHLHKYTVIRYPKDRFISSFYECVKRNKILHDGCMVDKYIWFIENLDSIKDVHIFPQSDFINDFKLDKIYLLERLRLKHHERKSKRDNSIVTLTYSGDFDKTIKKYYDKDFELYERNFYDRLP